MFMATTVGEARMYLQGAVERDLFEAETHIKLFSKTDVASTLRKTAQGIYQLSRNLRRNKEVPSRIPANLQICYDDLIELSDEAGRKILPSLKPAEKEAVKRLLLAKIEMIRKKIRTVESILVQLEKEGQRNKQHMST